MPSDEPSPQPGADSEHPEPSEAEGVESEAVTSDAAESEAAEPEAADPDAAEPETAEPDAAEPDAAESEAAESEAAEPDAAEPEAAGAEPAVGAVAELESAMRARRTRRIRVVATLVTLIVSALVLVVGAVVLSTSSVELDVPPPESAQVAGVQETQDLLKGVDQRGLTIGDKDAPFTLIEFLDVQCPFCRAHQVDEQPRIVQELVRSGRVKLRLAPEVVPGFNEESDAGRAIALRLARDGKAWDFISLFLYNQDNENTGYATDAFMRKLLAEIPGTAPGDAKRTPDARDQKVITELRDLANTLRVEGTPAFALGRSGKDPSAYVLLDLDRGDSAADQIITAVARLERQFKR